MLQKIQQWFLPYTCILCGKPSGIRMDLCTACETKLPWITEACSQCAQPLENSTEICGFCLKNSPLFIKTVALFRYQPPIDSWIIGLKFHHRLLYANITGLLLAERIANNSTKLPDIIIPVPLHPKRLKERGFNQAVELAKPLAKKLKIPLDLNNCQRIRMTEPQSLIPAKQRHKNVRNAFRIAENFSAKHIAIVDDVMTTGHTINELALALHKNGVEQIEVWCVAKTSATIPFSLSPSAFS